MEGTLLKILWDYFLALGGNSVSTFIGLFAAFLLMDRWRAKNGNGLPGIAKEQTEHLKDIKEAIKTHAREATERGREVQRSIDKMAVRVERCPARDN